MENGNLVVIRLNLNLKLLEREHWQLGELSNIVRKGDLVSWWKGSDLGKKFNSLIDKDALMTELGRMMQARVIKKWEIRGEGRTYEGVKWQPLAQSTINQKIYVTPPSLGGKMKKKGEGIRRGRKHMLVQTGEMLNALTYDTQKEGKDHVAKIFFLPPNNQKYYWHHFGMGKNLPSRPVLDVSKNDRISIDRVVKSEVEKATKKLFGAK